MGLLFAKLWKRLSKAEVEHKIVMIGNANAGKTTTLYKLVLGEAIATAPTVGSNVEELTYKNVKFVVWDLGGQESLKRTWETYYSNTSAIILVIDSTDVEAMTSTRGELFSILHREDLRHASILIFANKQDVKGALPVPDIATQLNLTAIKDHPYHIQGSCALTGEGLFEGLDWVTQQIAAAPEAAAGASTARTR
eukprot:a179338_11.p1 GENE.a179338_11~~a179338_11.p1  ORF type:complete len:204 (-),score=52.34 a179338_11:121-705(-)